MLPPTMPLIVYKLSRSHKLAILVYFISMFIVWKSIAGPWYCSAFAIVLHIASYAGVLYTLFESFTQEEKETLAEENNNNG